MTTRRKFLDGIVGASAVVPFAVAAASAAAPASGRNPLAAPLFLWDTAVAASFGEVGQRIHGGVHLNVALQDTAWMHKAELLLRSGAHHSVVVVGRSATVFVVNQLLGAHWRVAAEGVHDRGAMGEHLLSGAAPVLSRMASSRQNFSDPYYYAGLLAAQTAFVPGPWSEVKIRTNAWSRSEFVSMLAIPRWSKV